MTETQLNKVFLSGFCWLASLDTLSAYTKKKKTIQNGKRKDIERENQNQKKRIKWKEEVEGKKNGFLSVIVVHFSACWSSLCLTQVHIFFGILPFSYTESEHFVLFTMRSALVHVYVKTYISVCSFGFSYYFIFSFAFFFSKIS